MLCPQCGSEVADGNAFCSECGYKLGASANTTQFMDQAPAVPKNVASQQAAGDAASKLTGAAKKAAKKAKKAAEAKKPKDPAAEARKKKIILIVVAVLIGLMILNMIISAIAMSCSNNAVEQMSNMQVKQSTGTTGSDNSSLSQNNSGSSQNSSSSTSSSSSSSSSSKNSVIGSPSEDYILPLSETRSYTEAEIGALSNYELWIARNEIFARHGREFTNSELSKYFNSKDWYSPRYSPQEFDSMPSPLNQIERDNIKVIQSLERSRGSEYIS